MSRKFVVAVDGSEHGWKALDLAADLARLAGAQLIVVHVIRPEPVPKGLEEYARLEGIPPEELRARYLEGRRIGDRIIEDAIVRAHEKGATDVTGRVLEGDTVEEIVNAARAEGAEMLFVGSRGLSDLTGLLLGSVSHKVLQLAPCTAVAVR